MVKAVQCYLMLSWCASEYIRNRWCSGFVNAIHDAHSLYEYLYILYIVASIVRVQNSFYYKRCKLTHCKVFAKIIKILAFGEYSEYRTRHWKWIYSGQSIPQRDSNFVQYILEWKIDNICGDVYFHNLYIYTFDDKTLLEK